jgi:hypothetical protein
MAAEERGALTVHERLQAAGLQDEFDASIRARDGQRAVAVLVRAGFSAVQANATVQAIFKRPHYYGFA